MPVRTMRTGRAGAAAALTLAMLLAAAPASADEQITAAPPNRYVTTEVTIDQGERVTFSNADVAEHDVLARGEGPDGKPLFRSKLTPFGETATVEGTEYLTTGSYAFFCSLHPQMEGMLNVTSAGKPAARPQPGAAPGAAIELRVLDKRIAKVRRRGSLRVRVVTKDDATVQAIARAKGKRFAKGTEQLAGGQAETLKLPLTRAGRRLVAKKRRLPVAVTAKVKGGGEKAAKDSAKTKLR